MFSYIFMDFGLYPKGGQGECFALSFVFSPHHIAHIVSNQYTNLSTQWEVVVLNSLKPKWEENVRLGDRNPCRFCNEG